MPGRQLLLVALRPCPNRNFLACLFHTHLGINPNAHTYSTGRRQQWEEASLYEKPFEYVRKNVKGNREEIQSEQRSTKRWWLHQRPRPEMWFAIGKKTRYIVSPRVTKHRIFMWVNTETVPDGRLLVIARDDDYFFGVLHSHIHELWSLRTSPRHGIGNDPTYNAESCFETFPFPWSPGKEGKDDPRVQAIAQAAKELVEQRDRWLNAQTSEVSLEDFRSLT